MSQLSQTEKPFPEQLADALAQVSARDAVSIMCGKAEFENAKYKVYRWKKGEPVGMRLAEAPKYVARLAAHLNIGRKRQSNALVSSYATFVCDTATRPQVNNMISSLSSLQRLERNVDIAWVYLALRLHLMATAGEAKAAFIEGWARWTEAKEGYLVPESVFYCLRGALFKAKEQLRAADQINDVVMHVGRLVPLTAEMPILDSFDSDAPENHDVSPAEDLVASDQFHRSSFGDTNVKHLYFSEPLNIGLRSGSADLVLLDTTLREPYSLPSEWQEFAWLACSASLSRPGVDLFNGFKVRFRDPFCLGNLTAGSVRVQQTTYLASEITNWSNHLVFCEVATGRQVRLSNHYNELTIRKMSSHFGVMALLVTADSRLVAMFQDLRNGQAGGNLVPFGGSVEYLDIDALHEPRLGALLKYSMAREVVEEAVLAERSALDVVLLAHTIDAAKMRKPDFFGVCFIRETWKQIEDNREPHFGGRLKSFDIDLSSASALRFSLDAAESAWKKHPTAGFLHASLAFMRDGADEIVTAFAELTETDFKVSKLDFARAPSKQQSARST